MHSIARQNGGTLSCLVCHVTAMSQLLRKVNLFLYCLNALIFAAMFCMLARKNINSLIAAAHWRQFRVLQTNSSGYIRLYTDAIFPFFSDCDISGDSGEDMGLTVTSTLIRPYLGAVSTNTHATQRKSWNHVLILLNQRNVWPITSLIRPTSSRDVYFCTSWRLLKTVHSLLFLCFVCFLLLLPLMANKVVCVGWLSRACTVAKRCILGL